MSPKRSKILVHLHRSPLPVDGGDKRRVMGILSYFRSRQDFLVVDGFGGNTAGRIEWTEQDILAVKPLMNNFQVYQGEANLFDFLYSRSKSFYYQKILGQQLPIDTDYFAPPSYVQFVRKLIAKEKYNYLWLNYIDYAPLATQLKQYSDIEIFIDIHDLGCQSRLVMNDIDYLKKLKFNYQKNLAKEGKLLNKFDRVIVNSIQEIKILNSYVAEEKLALIPHLLENEIDVQSIVPYLHREFNYDLLFVGTGRSPNLKGMNFFLENIFPQIVAQNPDVILALVGSIDRVIKIPAKFSHNVITLGYVENLSTVYLRTKVNICPLLKGAGTKVKLQEALAYALPIVTTTVGASGLKLEDGVNAYIADEPEEFANKVLAMLNHEQLRQEFSTAANLVFQQHYSSERIYQKLDRLFRI
ncbi:MAG: glycosyltransferase family 4 protein [Waterburya sp.]